MARAAKWRECALAQGIIEKVDFVGLRCRNSKSLIGGELLLHPFSAPFGRDGFRKGEIN